MITRSSSKRSVPKRSPSASVDKLSGDEKKKRIKCSRRDRKRDDWDYEKYGPAFWPKIYPDGYGIHQSPINIETSNSTHVKYDSTLGRLLIDYEKCQPDNICNNGHSFQVNFDSKQPATLSGGPLKDKYQLSQFHGHWGKSSNSHGSEHTINSRSFPAEFHFVHVNTKYSNFNEAIKHVDGIAVIGVFVKIAKKPNKQFNNVVNDLKDVECNDQPKPLDHAVEPQKLIPKDRSRYFTYNGSLTTPPLTECVIWLVMATPLLITETQLSYLYNLRQPGDMKLIGKNYRPVCPLNGRVVRASFSDYKSLVLEGSIKD